MEFHDEIGRNQVSNRITTGAGRSDKTQMAAVTVVEHFRGHSNL